MNCITGVFCKGQIVLDQPVDWEEGAPVTVVCETDAASAGADPCCDGSRWEDSPEGVQRWSAWFDALTPVFAGEELTQFEADLCTMREEQKGLLPQWQERTGHLLR